MARARGEHDHPGPEASLDRGGLRVLKAEGHRGRAEGQLVRVLPGETVPELSGERSLGRLASALRRLHKGAELLVVAAGLVQVDLGTAAPVMRAGDAVLATRVAIESWRNLAGTPARLFWVLRD